VRSESSTFDKLALAYDSWFEGKGKFIFETEVKALDEVLSLLHKPWLEIGVGSGRFAQALGIGTGIDPSTKLLGMARRRGIRVFHARGEDEFFDDDSFGTVFIILTLCFVETPIAVLQEACRILKPEGKLVLGLILRDSPWGRFYTAKKREGHRFYRHATLFDYHEVEWLFQQVGFDTDKIVSTLFQVPDRVKEVEAPKEGLSPDAGFTVIVANKLMDAW